jgi:uncharacterized protein
MGTDETELAKVVPAPPPKPQKSEFGALPDEKPAEAPATEAPTVDATRVIDPAAAATDAVVENAGSPPPTVAPAAPLISEPAENAAASSLATNEPLTPVAPSEEQPSAGSAAEAVSPQPVKNRIAELAAQVVVEQLATELNIGTHLLRDILNSFTRPGLDPRESFPPPLFRRGITKLEDLQPGMELQATVLNVVDFGVFVDIGLSDSGLIHISRLADRYIRDPHEVVGVGDVLKVWVVEVDKNRRRVSLTAIAPGSEKPARPPRERGPRRPRQEGAQGRGGPQPAGAGAPAGDRPPRQFGDRPQGQRPPGDRQRDDRRGDRPRGDRPGGDRPPGDRAGGPPRDRQGGGQRSGPPRGRGQDRRRDEAPQPRIIERPPTKPKVDKPLTKAQQEGRAPMRSFGDLQQFFEKKKDDSSDSK